nr:MAG TPA: hypothetical protein [Caudoviricetes sp.]
MSLSLGQVLSSLLNALQSVVLGLYELYCILGPLPIKADTLSVL